MMKKILFIMLELASASGLCVRNVTEELEAKGYQVDILTYAGEGVACDGIDIHEIRPKLFLSMQKRCPRLRQLFCNAYRLQVAAFTPLWPMNAPLFSRNLYKRAEDLIQKNDYDCVVAVYTQVDPLVTTHLLKKQYPHLKTVAYFLDSMSAGPTPRLMREEQKISRALRWERYLLDNFDSVIYMMSSKAHHELHSSSAPYYSRVHFMDIPMLKQCRQVLASREEGPLVLTYVGSLPLQIRNPMYALRLLSQLDGTAIRLRFIGPVPDSERFQKESAALVDIDWVGPVPHDKIGPYIQEADVLLNFGNIVSGMVPSKIFEYMSYGKPILSFAPCADEPSILYLNKYPAACVVQEQEDFAQNLSHIRNFLGSVDRMTVDPRKIMNDFYQNTPACFAEYLAKLLGESYD